MTRRFALPIAALLGASLAFGISNVPAQQKPLKDQLVGTWTLVSIDQTDKDGKKQEIFGANPRGIQVFAASGQWVQIITRSDVPKFAVNNRQKGTPDENTAAVRGATATFGTWTVDDASKTLTVRYVGSMFPNQVGTESKRTINVTGDELKVTNPATASGVISNTVWRRAKVSA
jgi:Lipocalin-like domain